MHEAASLGDLSYPTHMVSFALVDGCPLPLCSLPVPVSPSISTVASNAAIRRMRRSVSKKTADSPRAAVQPAANPQVLLCRNEDYLRQAASRHSISCPC